MVWVQVSPEEKLCDPNTEFELLQQPNCDSLVWNLMNLESPNLPGSEVHLQLQPQGSSLTLQNMQFPNLVELLTM